MWLVATRQMVGNSRVSHCLSSQILTLSFSLPTSISSRWSKPSSFFPGWCCHDHPGPGHWQNVSMGNIWIKSQKNLEADAGLHQLSGPWPICHILFPIAWLCHKPWGWCKVFRLPLLHFQNSVSKVQEKRKSGTLTVSCFFLLFLFFSPKQYRSLCLRGGKVTSKDKRETKAQRLIFHSVILWHQNSEKQDSCLQAAYITEETWKMGK